MYNDIDVSLLYERLNTEETAWGVLALGQEAASLFIIKHGDAHNGAEVIMSAFHECVQRDRPDLARQWLGGLSATYIWKELLTQKFFVDWLEKNAPDVARSRRELFRAREKDGSWENEIWIESENELEGYCREMFRGLRQWLEEDEQKKAGIGGYVACVALNRTRWNYRRRGDYRYKLEYPADFGLVFLPDEVTMYEGSLLYEVLEKRSIVIRRVVLGTDEGGENVLD